MVRDVNEPPKAMWRMSWIFDTMSGFFFFHIKSLPRNQVASSLPVLSLPLLSLLGTSAALWASCEWETSIAGTQTVHRVSLSTSNVPFEYWNPSFLQNAPFFL